MYGTVGASLQGELEAIRQAGTFKDERVIVSPQSADITVQGGQEVLNFCANNYLGLSDDPALIEAAKAAGDNTVIELSGAEAEAFAKITLPVRDRVVKELGAEAVVAAMQGK